MSFTFARDLDDRLWHYNVPLAVFMLYSLGCFRVFPAEIKKCQSILTMLTGMELSATVREFREARANRKLT